MAPKSNIPHTGIVADVWICVCVCVCAFVRASKINAGTAEQDREDLSVVSLCVPDLQPLVSAPPPPLRQSWSVHLVFSEKAIASPGDWDCGHFQVLRSIGSTVVSRSLHNSIDTLGTRTNLSIHVLDFLKKRTNHEFIQNDDDKTEQ
jgi:hypothetical protein